jgi:hypothetical protein
MNRRTDNDPARRDTRTAGAGGYDRQRGSMVVTLGGRLVGAALLVAMGWIHLYLYNTGYRTVATIGPLFLLNAVLGAFAALAVLAVPRRWLGWASLIGAVLQAGTLGALLLSLTVGLLGFHESTKASLVTTTIVVELAGAVVLLALAVREFRPQLRARASRRGSD